MGQVMGENPQYDEAAERMLAATRAHYALVEGNVAHEQRKEELKAAVDSAQRLEEKARIALEDAKRAVRVAKSELARADTDLRSHRRAENARLQKEAEAVGSKTYATNTPCRHGHFSPRYTSSGACVECDRIGWEDGKLKSLLS
jgi:chromosome segregation ATPase